MTNRFERCDRPAANTCGWGMPAQCGTHGKPQIATARESAQRTYDRRRARSAAETLANIPPNRWDDTTRQMIATLATIAAPSRIDDALEAFDPDAHDGVGADEMIEIIGPLDVSCAGELAGICSGGPAHHPDCADANAIVVESTSNTLLGPEVEANARAIAAHLGRRWEDIDAPRRHRYMQAAAAGITAPVALTASVENPHDMPAPAGCAGPCGSADCDVTCAILHDNGDYRESV